MYCLGWILKGECVRASFHLSGLNTTKKQLKYYE